MFALGTTDTANLALTPGGVSRRERIDRMMTVAAGEPVLWVNTRTIVASGEWSDPWMQLWNQELRAAQSRWPNLKIYDWSSVGADAVVLGRRHPLHERRLPLASDPHRRRARRDLPRVNERDDFLIARNPDADSSLPFLVRLPLGIRTASC